MSEILSQQEIDGLLSGLPAGKVTAHGPVQGEDGTGKEATIFDFRLPHRLSKNQLRTLQSVHETFAEALGSYLAARLQTEVSVQVRSVEQIFYSEFTPSVANPSCLYVFRIQESHATALLEMTPQLILAIVEYLMGGSTVGGKDPRAITRIEQSIVKSVVLQTLADLQRAWKAVADLTFVLERYESEGELVQIAPATEIVMAMTFEVFIGGQSHRMSVCFPTFAMDDVLEKLSPNSIVGIGGGRTTDNSSWFARQLRGTKVVTTALLGETTITLRELLELGVGDVLRTSLPADADVQIVIDGKTRMIGKPGISNGQLAVKISSIGEDPA